MDPYENPTQDDRREAIAKSLHLITVAELEKLGEEIFVSHDHPWREPFFAFLKEHKSHTFYEGNGPGNLRVIYCAEAEKGFWVVTGLGFGLLQSRGVTALKEILAERGHA